MNTSNILKAVAKYVKLDDEEVRYFSSLFIPIQVRQGEFADTAGEIAKGFMYVNSGCLMLYFTDEHGDDHVIQFAPTGWWTGDLHSFTQLSPSIYTIRALADSEVLLLPRNSLEQLLEQIPKLERYFRNIFQNSLITHQQRLIQNFSATAEERYDQFRKKYPPLEQFVPLKYIASYIGITPEFLSKIRRRRSKG